MKTWIVILVILALGFFFLTKDMKKGTDTKSNTNLSQTTVSLSENARQKLIALVNSDSEAKDLFSSVKSDADKALKETPNPIDRIQSSGILKGDVRKTESLASVKDADKVYVLGFSYAVTHDETYAKKAREFLLAWATKNKSSKDPIDERLLLPMFTGYDLIKNTLSQEDKTIINTWMIDSANTLIAAINPNGTSWRNNHNSHLIAVVTTIGYALGDQKLIDYATAAYKKQIEMDLNPDGSSFDFYQRDALYYHVFTLEPLLVTARIMRMNGLDLYSYRAPSGSSLPKSIDFLMPYVTGEKTHAEWVNSASPFDKTRADFGYDEFQPGVLFRPEQAYQTLELDYYFNPDILPEALKLSGRNAKKYPDFTMVYLEAIR